MGSEYADRDQFFCGQDFVISLNDQIVCVLSTCYFVGKELFVLPHPSLTILSIPDPLTSPICRDSDTFISQLVKRVQAKFGLLASLDRILVRGDASRGGERRAFGNPDLKYHQCRYQ